MGSVPGEGEGCVLVCQNTESVPAMAASLERTKEPEKVTGNDVILIFLTTIIVACTFTLVKQGSRRLRSYWARARVVVIGAGPIGLTAALIALRAPFSSRVILYEEASRWGMIRRVQQIALDAATVTFLQQLGVDFDNIEGCWGNGCFFTRIGIFQEYLLSLIEQFKEKVEIRLRTKVGSVTLVLKCLS